LRRLVTEDDGTLRCCPNNKAAVGFWISYKRWYSYRKELREFPLIDVIEAVRTIGAVSVWIILFPIMPMLKCWLSVRDAKRQVAAEEASK
jgi:hypothetical protein